VAHHELFIITEVCNDEILLIIAGEIGHRHQGNEVSRHQGIKQNKRDAAGRYY